MARRRKNRTHLKGPDHNADTDGNPKSFVIKHGHVGSSLGQLVRDLRKIMEPNTASRLKVRRELLASCEKKKLTASDRRERGTRSRTT